MTSQNIKQKYAELCNPPGAADAIWNRARGFNFEKLLAQLLREDNLDPRTSFKSQGEQIDGSFFLDGTVFLLEAKWHATEIPASTLYQFKGKVDGKLTGTLGVFISMSGYSVDAVDALTLGKSLNLILFDKKDIDAAIHLDLGFREILKRKLRKAAEEGIVYFPSEANLITSQSSTNIEIENCGFDSYNEVVFSQATPISNQADLIILCEGNSDRELISHLAKRILTEAGSKKRIKIVTAMGKYSIPKVANALRSSFSPAAKILIVIDSDGELERSKDLLERNISFTEWSCAIPDPEIEIWLGITRASLMRQSQSHRIKTMIEAAEKVNIRELCDKDAAFLNFYNTIITP